MGMDMKRKLEILTGAAKYDVACTSSGSSRGAQKGMTGNTEACGICHSFSGDGRCISLLKILLTNHCEYDCQYCANRRSNDVPRAAFTPREIADLTLNFYKRNYIEGLFLSSAIVKNPDHTMELMIETLRIVREEYGFNGYIHVKGIPGASSEMIHAAGMLADRMSVNIELPSADGLLRLAPDKSKPAILKPMRQLTDTIIQAKNEIMRYRHAPKFVPAGQSTQMIVGATEDTDRKIVTLAEGLYKSFALRRVFYSAFIPVPTTNPFLPTSRAPLLREHRLYQADWLLRFYGFQASEILDDNAPNLSLNMDPKCGWAIRHMEHFPLEVNRAPYEMLLRVPGIGVRSAQRILAARRVGVLRFEHLKKMGIVLKRAKYFITCAGQMYEKMALDEDILMMRLSENKIGEQYEQLTMFEPDAGRLLPRFDANVGTGKRASAGMFQSSIPRLEAAQSPVVAGATALVPLPTGEDDVKCLTGEL